MPCADSRCSTADPGATPLEQAALPVMPSASCAAGSSRQGRGPDAALPAPRFNRAGAVACLSGGIRRAHCDSISSVVCELSSDLATSTLISPGTKAPSPPSGMLSSSQSALFSSATGAVKITALVPAAVMRSW
jgi:hypothetical protein